MFHWQEMNVTGFIPLVCITEDMLILISVQLQSPRLARLEGRCKLVEIIVLPLRRYQLPSAPLQCLKVIK